MLVAVTEDGGTGTEAAIPGYRVTGKTATAQKVDAATGKYSNDRYTSSFVGAVPAERPRVVVAVVLDEPIIGHYGGDLAGPVFRRVASAALRYLGVPPTHGKGRGAKVREALEREVAEAAALGTSSPAGRSVVSETLVAQAPPPRAADASATAGGDTAKPDVPPGVPTLRVPDCSALSMREAVRTLSEKGFVPVVEGSGKLVRQVPERGSTLAKGSVVRLVFDPGA
jgi:cell division protein FtsI (penicillin-binding protein 3)